MTAPYVTRRSINATEDVLDEETGLSSAEPMVTYQWTATLDGYLSTGERVEMTRHGATFATAVAALEAAIAENGWTIRERGTR
ncbi:MULTISPECIES: hypothetical protein [unclassified Microbacterium]|uniref:hypothetical protein n=1 Tax=unclassified Microbacterium TaxID=2609290 RepID=UPI000EA8B5CD|nr:MULTISPECIES: hypothetical protein [unclassified Microbacterium]MBT2484775.1 hypothetical protein [Microbacterium sp. ISL-108]RKN67651.1 hypothetical protein D7252_08685 [Microbacterium sp. CGR2]